MFTVLFVSLCVFITRSAAVEDVTCNANGKAYPPNLKPLPSGEAKNVSTFVVNLDEDAATRWNAVVVPLKAEIDSHARH